jgi:hypothetical protein
MSPIGQYRDTGMPLSSVSRRGRGLKRHDAGSESIHIVFTFLASDFRTPFGNILRRPLRGIFRSYP